MRYLITLILFLQYFSAAAQPWITQVADLCPANNCNSNISNLVVCYNRLYFTADMGMGRRAYATADGTAQGTYMLDSTQATWHANASSFVEYNGQVLFMASAPGGAKSLYLADAVSSSAQSIFATATIPFTNIWGNLIVYNGKAYFAAQDAANGVELWETDGTAAGTQLLVDIEPGTMGSYPQHFTVMNNQLYFVTNTSLYGRELWVTDGTTAGTHMVADMYPGIDGSSPSELTVMNNQLYFACHVAGGAGWGLGTSDGTAMGTQAVMVGIGQPANMMTEGGKLYFSAANNGSAELYVSNGTPLGTYMIKDINQDGDPTPLATPVAYNGLIYFAEKFNGVKYLWQTDSTNAGTVMVKGPFENPRWMTTYCDKLYFVAENMGSGNPQLWVYDGSTVQRMTPEIDLPHTLKADAIPPGIAGLHMFNGSLYYPANYDNTNEELWRITDFPLSVGEVSRQVLQLYPNPAKDRLTVTTTDMQKGRVVYSIVNTLGQNVQQGSQDIQGNKMTVTIEALAPGMYWLQLCDVGKQVYRAGFVKE